MAFKRSAVRSRLSSPALPRLPFPLPSQAHSRQRRGCGDSRPPSSATGSGAPKSHQTVCRTIFYIDNLLNGVGFFVLCGKYEPLSSCIFIISAFGGRAAFTPHRSAVRSHLSPSQTVRPVIFYIDPLDAV